MRATLRRVAPYAAPAALALTVAALMAAMLAMRTEGHWWGDDWALYVRQARALLLGTTDQVAAENLFTDTMSDGAGFSPPIYPWGFPLLLALFIPFVGDGVDQLSIVGKLSLCVFCVCWYALAARRIGKLGALVGMLAACATPVIIGWTDLIQSELPFMAAAGVVLVALDYLATGDRLIAASARVWPLVALGVATSFAFEIRREGLALVPAIFTAHVVVLWAHRERRRDLDRSGWVLVGARVALPYLALFVSVQLTRWLLPSVIVAQSGDGTGPANVWRDWDDHVKNLAKMAGLQKPHATEATVLGDPTLGRIVVITWFALVAVGLVVAVTARIRRDSFLAAFALAAFVIGCSAKANLPRYFAAAVPIFTLLALAGVAYLVGVLAGARLGRFIAPAVVVLLALPITAANLISIDTRVGNASQVRELGIIEWGAQHPDAIEMFDAVRRFTDPDDIVAAPKARVMVLETERWAVQVDDYRPLPPDVDVELVVAETSGTRVAEFAAMPDEWAEVWRNDRFVLFKRER